MRFYLLYDTSKECKIEGECQIGRRQGDLILGDELLSGIHGKFYVEKGKLYVMDLGSTNGTFINKKKIPPKLALEVMVDDEVTMGSHHFTIRSKESTVITFTGEVKIDQKSKDNMVFETAESLLEKTAIDKGNKHLDIHLNTPHNLENHAPVPSPKIIHVKDVPTEAPSTPSSPSLLQRMQDKLSGEKLIITTALTLGVLAFLLTLKQQKEVSTPVTLPTPQAQKMVKAQPTPAQKTPIAPLKVETQEEMNAEFNAQAIIESYDPFKEAILLSELSKLKTEFKRTQSKRVKDALEIDAIDTTTAHYLKVKESIKEEWKNSRNLAEEKKKTLKKKLESQLESVNNREKLIKARVSSFLNGQLSTPF